MPFGLNTTTVKERVAEAGQGVDVDVLFDLGEGEHRRL
jgi:hypothetical protein